MSLLIDSGAVSVEVEASAAHEHAREIRTLEDLFEEMQTLRALGSEILIHLREMTGITPGEELNQ